MAGARGFARAGIGRIFGGNLEESFVIGGLLHLATSMGESGNNELLCQTGTHSLSSAESKVAKNQADTTIRLGIPEIGECCRCQISAETGIIWPPAAVIIPAHKRTEKSMPDPRTRCARPLIKVARILM